MGRREVRGGREGCEGRWCEVGSASEGGDGIRGCVKRWCKPLTFLTGTLAILRRWLARLWKEADLSALLCRSSMSPERVTHAPTNIPSAVTWEGGARAWQGKQEEGVARGVARARVV